MKLIQRLVPIACLAFAALSAIAVDVTAQSAAIFDEASGRVLWSKNAEVLKYPASTTKIMTALLLIERCRPEEIIVAPKDIETVTDSSMHLRPGERISAREILYGVLLRSANDACHAVAVHISGSDKEFAKLMNERAKQIGCRNPRFHNPHGLNDKEHMVSARDLGLIACEAMKYPEFREVVKQRKHCVVRSTNLEDRWMINHNKALWHDPTTDGVKTGYTVPAGRCFVGSAMRNGYRLITVIMNSQDWQADHFMMLRWAFANHSMEKVIEKGTVVGKASIKLGESRTVPAVIAGGLKVALSNDKSNVLSQHVSYFDGMKAPIKEGDKIGVWSISDGKGWTRTINLVAGANVDRLTIAQKARRGIWPYVWGLAGLFAARWIYMQRVRGRRKYSYARYR